MAWSSAHCSPYQNSPFGGKDNFAGAAPSKGNDTHTPTSAMLPAYNPTPVLAPNLVKQVFKYTNNDLQRATKLALKSFRQGQQ